MQGCTSEWRTKFQMEATTRDSKRGQSGNTVILCTPLLKFLHPPQLDSIKVSNRTTVGLPSKSALKVDANVSIGPSLCSEWSVSVAGTECRFS